MPGMYPGGEYDLAGFAVGIVEKSRIIDGRRIAPGDAVLGLASSGAHSNGYSLIRRVIEHAKPSLEADFHGRPLADVLMEPTHIYVKPVLELLRQLDVKGLAHITGGGLLENIPRVLPDNVCAGLKRSAWTLPPLFAWLRKESGIDETELHRVFNCGIGMVLIVAAADADKAAGVLEAGGETVYRLGAIEARAPGAEQVRIG
jgi:phosphoribosylformylglycinamidine cyclo-ligase